jgi:hypothetical protein
MIHDEKDQEPTEDERQNAKKGKIKNPVLQTVAPAAT